MITYFYWRCRKCRRHFRSQKVGGRDVECSCGCILEVVETTKKEYDLWRKGELEKCKAT